MIFSYLFLQLLKIVVFLAIPAQVIIRNLQIKTQNQHSKQKNKNALIKLVTVGIIYSLYAIIQLFNFSNQVCFWWLLLLSGSALYLRAYGYLDMGIEKAMQILTKAKSVNNNLQVKVQEFKAQKDKEN